MQLETRGTLLVCGPVGTQEFIVQRSKRHICVTAGSSLSYRFDHPDRSILYTGDGALLHRSREDWREKLEHAARYVSRPPVATVRLALTERGLIRCGLRTAYGVST